MGTTFGAIQHHIFKGAICQMLLCRTIRSAILHCIFKTKMVLNSTNTGSLASKEPLKELNSFFVWQWCYISLESPQRTAEEPYSVRIDGNAIREAHLVWTAGFSSWAVIMCWRICLYTSFFTESWCPPSSSRLAICEKHTYWSNQRYSRTY